MKRIWYLIALIISILMVFLSALDALVVISTKDSERILVQLTILALFIYGIVYFGKKLKEKSSSKANK